MVLLSKQKLLNRLSITHDPRLRKHYISSDPLTPPRGKTNWCQTWLGNTQGVRFSQLALYIPRSSADIFTDSIMEKYLGATWRPRYNGVAVQYYVGSLAKLRISCLGIFYHITGNRSIVNKPNAASPYLS